MESDAGGFTPRGFALDMDDSRIEKIRAGEICCTSMVFMISHAAEEDRISAR
jgi:hypothetical protein